MTPIQNPKSKIQNPPTSFWTAVRAIVWKDLTVERHTGQTISVMLFFSIAAVVTFNLAIVGKLDAGRNVSAGLLWVIILLAGTLGLNRSFAAERENQSMDALLMAPIERSAIYVGKVISITLFTLLLELVLVVLFTVFFNRPFLQWPVLGLLVLGTLGYTAVGVLITAMTLHTRSREVLLPILLLPLTLPAVLSVASATAAYVFDPTTPWSAVSFQVSLVILYDVLMLAAGYFTFGYVVEG
ncbi:MAG: heme exporter protein CcmB [Chloroflexi bacterium]|nr:heme exporter protein CcmB [Chloroflexota bacterium]